MKLHFRKNISLGKLYLKFNPNQIMCMILALCGMIAACAISNPWVDPVSITWKPIIMGVMYAGAIAGVLFCIVMIHKERFNHDERILILMIIIAHWLLEHIHYYGDFPGVGGLNLSLIIIFTLLPVKHKILIFKYTRIIFLGICFMGICCIVSFFLDGPLIYHLTPFYESQSYNQYINFDWSYILLSSYTAGIRLCGLFTEPGDLATYSALLLCADGINLKKVSNIIIMIAGILSFSLVFPMILICYIIFSSIKKPKFIALMLVVVGLVLYVPGNVETGIVGVDTLISRMEITDKGISGDDRVSKKFDELFEEQMNSADMLWGYGSGYISKFYGAGGNASIKVDIFNHGILGTLLIFGTLFFVCMRLCNGNIKAILFTLVYFVALYRGTDIFNLLNFTILFGTIYTIVAKKSWLDNSKNIDFSVGKMRHK